MNPLQDGGGIYTLGNMAGTVIRGNHIHNNPGVPGGIYLDEGSGFIEVTDNVVYNVRTPMNYNNRAQNRVATCNEHDNFFSFQGKIDEVRLYNRALSAEEVKNNAVATGSADSQNKAVADGLVAHWSFDELPATLLKVERIIRNAGLRLPYRALWEKCK